VPYQTDVAKMFCVIGLQDDLLLDVLFKKKDHAFLLATLLPEFSMSEDTM
jgi:hypothetical protein